MTRGFVAVLGIGLVLAAVPRVAADERVDITALDGVQLIGELAGTAGPGVVLAPGEQRDRRTWATAADAIAARGFRTLRFDPRGQGESAGAADPAAADRDVEGAYRYLLGRKIRPVFLIGEGMGATASLVVATRVTVAGVVAVAPLARRDPLDPSRVLADLRLPLLFLASEADQATKALAALATSSRLVVVSDADLAASPRALAAILQFLETVAKR